LADSGGGLASAALFTEDWRGEWRAEFAHVAETLPSHWKRMRFASGAFSDACGTGGTGSSWTMRRGTLGSLRCSVLEFWWRFWGYWSFERGLPLTRAVVLPLAYAHPEHVATVAEGGMPSSIRSTVRREWADLWRSKSISVKELATYWWTKLPQGGKHARVSENFFDLLGARTDHGTLLNSDCTKCAVLSYRAFEGQESIVIRGERYRVVGVLERGFWFLAQDVMSGLLIRGRAGRRGW